METLNQETAIYIITYFSKLMTLPSLSEVYKLRISMRVVSDYMHTEFVDRVYEQHHYGKEKLL